MENRGKIKQHVIDMLNDSHKAMLAKIDSALDSGVIDIAGWDEKDAPMVAPKTIVAAILESEPHQYLCKGTYVERQVKRDVRNLSYFIN